MTAELICDSSSTLLDYVVAELNKRQDKEFMVIWRDTGIPYYWLRKIARGEIKNPGIQRIQFLYEFFSGKKLEV